MTTTTSIESHTSSILNVLHQQNHIAEYSRNVPSFPTHGEQQITQLLMQFCADLHAQTLLVIEKKENNTVSFVSCYKGRQQYSINANDIEYICSNPVTGVHLYTTDNKEFHTSKTLKSLKTYSVFTRYHRQYLVNKKYIRMIEKLPNGGGKAYTYSGKIIPISKRGMNKI